MIEVAPTRRVLAKQERRDRITDAAYELLRELGVGGLSIRLIAERARVSQATVYNLFGSRGAVMAQVFERDLRLFQALVDQAPSTDALDRIFDAVAVAVSQFRKDPAFYRAAMSSSFDALPAGDDSAVADTSVSEVLAPRAQFWMIMIEAAKAGKLLGARANSKLLGVSMTQAFLGAWYDWTLRVISLERLELEVAFSFCLVLSSHAATPARSRLRARMNQLEQDLAPGRPGWAKG